MSAGPERHVDPGAEASFAGGADHAPAAAPRAHEPRGRRFHPDYSAFNPRVKSPVVASFLSIIPGLGQIYVGYYAIGFLHAIVIASTITLAGSGILDEATPLAGLFVPFFWLYNIVDAGRRAAFYNLAVEGGENLPVPGPLPSFNARGGLVPVGVVLVAVGGIFLTNTAFGYSLRWLEDWWPMGPILLGAYLIAKGVADRQRPA